MAERWSRSQDLERDLFYAGFVSVSIPESCVEPSGGFVAVPSRASAGGFVAVDVEASDVRPSPEDRDVFVWDIFRDRAYRVMRAGSRNGKPRTDGTDACIDEAYFPGVDVLAVYRAAASDPDPEGLMAWAASGHGPAPDPGHVRLKVPEELVLAGEQGAGMVFPDPDAMGGVGLVGGPHASYSDGTLDLGGWCGAVWRLAGRSLVAYPACMLAQAVKAAVQVWSAAGEAQRKRFLFVKPDRLPPWPEFHGKDIVLHGVPDANIARTDLSGTIQVMVPETSGGTLFVLAGEVSVLPSDGGNSVYLGKSDMPVACRLAGGGLESRQAGRIARSARFVDAAGREAETVRICGISRTDVETDYSDCCSDVRFVGPDGFVYGFRVPMEELSEGDDGFLAVDLGGPDSRVRLYRVGADGMRESVPMDAAGLAGLLDRSAAAGRKGRQD